VVAGGIDNPDEDVDRAAADGIADLDDNTAERGEGDLIDVHVVGADLGRPVLADGAAVRVGARAGDGRQHNGGAGGAAQVAAAGKDLLDGLDRVVDIEAFQRQA